MTIAPPVPSLPAIDKLPPPVYIRREPKVDDYRHTEAPKLDPTPLPASQIVPEDDQNRLMNWEVLFTMGYFEIGDIAVRLIAQAPQVSQDSQHIVTHEQVYDAVGYFCRRKGRTVRYYAETAAFFPVHVRQEFDMLSFSHFVLARSFGERWREVLEHSATNPQQSVEGVRWHFAEQASERYTDLSPEDKARVRPPEDPQPGRLESSLVSLLSGLVDKLVSLCRREGISPETREMLLDILDKVREVIPRVREDIQNML